MVTKRRMKNMMTTRMETSELPSTPP